MYFLTERVTLANQGEYNSGWLRRHAISNVVNFLDPNLWPPDLQSWQFNVLCIRIRYTY